MADPFDWVALVLLVLYLILFGVGCDQLHTTAKSRNKRLTIRNGIVTILTAASLLRIFFWLKACIPTTISIQAGLMLFFLPVWMNFAGLSLLVVFYVQVISTTGPSKLPMRICVAANIALLVANLVIAGEMDGPEVSTGVKADMLIAYSVYGSLLDFTLALLLTYYGHLFKKASSRNVLTTRILPNSLVIFDTVNWIIIASYIFRGTFSAILSSGKVLPRDEGSVEFNGSHPPNSITTFLFFLVAEIVPCACVLGMLWKVSSSQGKHTHIQHHVDSLQRNVGDDSAIDSRLLSVEDSKVKVFINADTKTASIEDDDEATTVSYLLFEDTHKATYLEKNDEDDDESSILGPLPIPRRQNSPNPIPNPNPNPGSNSGYAHSMSPSPSSGSFSKIWGFGPFMKPGGSREPTPDLQHMNEATMPPPDGSIVARGTPSEAYDHTLSPRDILLHAERRRSLPKSNSK